MEVYGHLTPSYLQAEVDRLQIGLPISEAVAANEVAEQKLAANAESKWLSRLAAQTLSGRPGRARR